VFTNGVLKVLFFDGKGIVLSLLLLSLGTLSFSRLRRELWSGRLRQTAYIILINLSFLILALLAWFIAWIAILNYQYNDASQITAEYRYYLEASLVAAIILALFFLAVDRQIFLFTTVKNLSDLKIDSIKRIHGEKDVIHALVSKHTAAAKKSVLMFSGRMNYVERDRAQFTALSGIKFRNLALRPGDAADEAYLKIGESLGIETRCYKQNLDPLLRGRIIDPEIPRLSKMILITKEQDRHGKYTYSARVYSRQEAELFLDVSIHLFEALWADQAAAIGG
jgi:signal transduction histidine kinase